MEVSVSAMEAAEDQQPRSKQPSSLSSSSSAGGGGGSAEDQGRSEVKAQLEGCTTFFGRHRLLAAINKLQNEINKLQEELEVVETVGESSLVCKELITSVEAVRDPLLPVTRGPVDANWDQWFRGAHGGRSHKRWI